MAVAGTQKHAKSFSGPSVDSAIQIKGDQKAFLLAGCSVKTLARFVVKAAGIITAQESAGYRFRNSRSLRTRGRFPVFYTAIPGPAAEEQRTTVSCLPLKSSGKASSGISYVGPDLSPLHTRIHRETGRALRNEYEYVSNYGTFSPTIS